jgi:hypothetical protein
MHGRARITCSHSNVRQRQSFEGISETHGNQATVRTSATGSGFAPLLPTSLKARQPVGTLASTTGICMCQGLRVLIRMALTADPLLTSASRLDTLVTKQM